MQDGDTTITRPVAVNFQEMTVKDAANLVELLLSFESVRDAVDDSIPTKTLIMTAKQLELLQKVASDDKTASILHKDELAEWTSLTDMIQLT